MNSYNVISENSDTDLIAHRLVKFTATGVAYAGVTDDPVGTVLNDTLLGTSAAIALKKAFGLNFVTVADATAIVAGDQLDQAANGQVTKHVSGQVVGVAREPSTEAGSIIRAYLYASGTGEAEAEGDSAVDGLSEMGTARATFNPSLTAGMRTIAAHGLGVTIPNKAIVVGGFIQVNTTFTSATDAGTIAISIQGANDIVLAIAISNGGNPWDAGLHAIIPKTNTPESTGIALTADREITATVAVEALLTGKATIFLYYKMGA
jgi:hypothetical protein